MDTGSEVISDAAVLAAVRRQARRVQVRAVLAAAVITILYMWIS